MKTNYLDALLFVADHSEETSLVIDKQFYFGSYTVYFRDCILEPDGIHPNVACQSGPTLEIACEKLFRRLQGRNIISKNEVKFSFDEEFYAYKKFKRQERLDFPSFKEYTEIIADKIGKLKDETNIEVRNIFTRQIKDKTLFVINGESIITGEYVELFVYEKYCPDVGVIEKEDIIRYTYAPFKDNTQLVFKVEVMKAKKGSRV